MGSMFRRSGSLASIRNVLIAVLVTATASVASLGVTASSAVASSQTFCDNWLAPNGTCPPNHGSEGSVIWGHLHQVQGNSAGESHETCVDAYFEEEKVYTVALCMYYAGETADLTSLYTHERYGEPRSWNGGSVNHTVWGWSSYS